MISTSTYSFCRYINIAKTNRRPPSSTIACSLPSPSGGMKTLGKSPTSQPITLPSTQPLRSSMAAIPRGGPPIRQQSDELVGSPYSSLEESNGYGSFPGGTVIYQSDPRTGTTFIVPSNMSMVNIGGNSAGTGTYQSGPSSLEGYTIPPTANAYPSYDPSRIGGRMMYDGYSKGRVQYQEIVWDFVIDCFYFSP